MKLCNHDSIVLMFASCIYSRIGLMGNPSDGFYGKTIALSISNFWADVTIYESAKLVCNPHSKYSYVLYIFNM